MLGAAIESPVGSGQRVNTRQVMLFSERGVYKPGDTLFLKGIVRDDGKKGMAIPAGAKVKLEAFDPKLSRIVELRYFGGLTLEEAGEVLGTSTTAVWRDWNTARAWLYNELHGR